MEKLTQKVWLHAHIASLQDQIDHSEIAFGKIQTSLDNLRKAAPHSGILRFHEANFQSLQNALKTLYSLKQLALTELEEIDQANSHNEEAKPKVNDCKAAIRNHN